MKFNVFKSMKPILVKHQPEILMSMGLGGLIFSTLWGIKATFKATRKLQSAKFKKQDRLTKKEIFKEVWRLYLPVVISTSLSIPCIILGNRISTKRNTVLAAAYAISETALQEYKDQTKELIGEKKEQEIREKISEKKVNETYEKNDIFIIGDGDCLFCEPLSGRYFKSNWNKISKAANELNARAITSMNGVISLSDWFDELGLPSTALSDHLGWEITSGKNGIIDISILSSLTPDKIPCGSISYNTYPKPI